MFMRPLSDQLSGTFPTKPTSHSQSTAALIKNSLFPFGLWGELINGKKGAGTGFGDTNPFSVWSLQTARVVNLARAAQV